MITKATFALLAEPPASGVFGTGGLPDAFRALGCWC